MLVISVDEARKLLGKAFSKYSDDDIELMISILSKISSETIKDNVIAL